MSGTTQKSADAPSESLETRLSVYLNDHLAGSTNGIELAKRTAKENIGTPLGDWLDELTRELEEPEIAAILRHAHTDPTGLQAACQALIDAANQKGGGDNITVLLLPIP